MSDEEAHRRKPRAALYLLLCLIIAAFGGVGISVVKSRWGEGLTSNALFIAILLFCGVVLSRLLGVHPSQRRKPAVRPRADA